MNATVVDAPSPPPGRVWFALFAAPIAWAVQGLIAWFVESHSCGNRIPAALGIAAPGARAVVLGVSIVCGVVGVVALLIAGGRWRDSRDPGLTGVYAQTRPDFLAAAAMFVSFSFLVAMGLTAFAATMLHICETMR